MVYERSECHVKKIPFFYHERGKQRREILKEQKMSSTQMTGKEIAERKKMRHKFVVDLGNEFKRIG